MSERSAKDYPTTIRQRDDGSYRIETDKPYGYYECWRSYAATRWGAHIAAWNQRRRLRRALNPWTKEIR